MAVRPVGPADSKPISPQPAEAQKTAGPQAKAEAQAAQQADAVSVSISASEKRSESAETAHEPRRMEKAKERLDRLDSDKDRGVTREELQSLKDDRNGRGIKTPGIDHLLQNFSELDKNENGSVNAGEVRSQIGRPRPPEHSEPPPPPAEEKREVAPPPPREAAVKTPPKEPKNTEAPAQKNPQALYTGFDVKEHVDTLLAEIVPKE